MKTEEIFEKSSVWKAIAKMSIPAVITMLVMVIYNMTDTYFVGKTGDPMQIAAISLASPVFSLQTAMGTLIGAGGCAVISRALGKKDMELAKASSSAGFLLAVGSGVIIALLILAFPDFFLTFMGADAATWQFTKDYMVIMAVGIPCTLFTQAFANIVRAEGAVKESMIGNAVGTILNMVLDPLFITALGMGVRGAAVATVIGHVTSCVFFLVYIIKKSDILTLNPKYAFKRVSAFGSVISLGIPNAVSSLLMGIVNTISNNVIIKYGAGAIAAMGVGGKAGMIVSMVVMGICVGVQPLMAYNYGAGLKVRTKEILKKTGILTLGIGFVLGVICFIFRSSLAAMFLQDEALLAMSSHIMGISLLAIPLVGIFYLGVNFLQAAGNALWSSLLSAFRQGIFYIPMILLLDWCFGLEGVFWVSFVTDILSVAVSLVLLRRQLKKF